MKNVILILMVFAGMATGQLLAQGNQQALHKEKMTSLASWAGTWKGEATMQMGPGQMSKAIMEERIESKLDGTIIVVEGVGKVPGSSASEERIVHQAFAVLSYDSNSGEYKFRSHLSDGRSSDAWFKIVGANSYQWGFDTPRGKIRYNIMIDTSKKTWNETGEFSQDGNTWMKFLDMNLTKVD